MSKNQTTTKVIVPCRFSYLHCWEPEAINGGEPKYSVSAIIPKSDKETIKKIQAAVEAAKQESLSKWCGSRTWKHPEVERRRGTQQPYQCRG